MSSEEHVGGFLLARSLLGDAVIDELEERGARPVLTLVPTEGDDLSGAQSYFCAVANDIESAQERTQRLATMGELGAGAIHEVRNAVTSIRGFTDLARRRAGGQADVDEMLERIGELTTTCIASLSAYLGFVSGAQSGIEAFDVNRVIREAAILVRHQLSVNGIGLEIDTADEVPRVRGRAAELSQVLVNLAINAQQAMTSGGTVWLSSATGPSGSALVRIADDGPGVPLELREKIFEPFFTTKERGIGTGLGLAISARLIRDCRGTILVGDSPRGGALFTIELAPADSA